MRHEATIGVASPPMVEQGEAQETKANSMWLIILRQLRRSSNSSAVDLYDTRALQVTGQDADTSSLAHWF